MSTRYDAVIIGAGVIGAAVAFEMAKKGHKTLNADKLPASGYGSTSNSCAIIRLHYSTPDGVAFAREGYYYWLKWPEYLGADDEQGLVKYVNTGCLVTKNERNRYLANVIAALKDLDVPFEELTAEHVRQRWPFLDTRAYWPVKLTDDPGFGSPTAENIAGAVYIPESGYITDPQLSAHNLQRAAEAKGAEFTFNAEVTAVRQKDGRVAGVTLADGSRIDAPVVVNVAGPHSYIINRMAGVEDGMKIKTRALRQEVAHVPSPPGLDYDTRGMIISDGDIGCYSRPEVGNHILIGSEDPECDTLEYVDPDDYNRNFTAQWDAQVQREAQRVKNLPVSAPLKGIVDLYDVTDDWLPIYDKSDLPGFYMAVGTSGNQYKNAPVAGLMMAELIEACEAGRDHDKEPYQFYMAHTRRHLNVGFFSRLREINRDSSFSVIG